MRLHGVLRLVLLHAESADKGLGGGGVLVQEVPLEVAEVLDHLSAEQALVTISHLSDRQPPSKEKKFSQDWNWIYALSKILGERQVIVSFNIYLHISNNYS